jgi:cytochrome P450
VLETRQENFAKGLPYHSLADSLGWGLVTLVDPDTHAAHRRIVSPAFAPQVLTKIANTTMREHAMALHGQLVDECMKSGGSRTECTVTVKGLIHRTALNIIAESAFHLDKPEVDAFAASLHDMFLLRFNLLRLFRITPILRHFPFHLLDRQYYRRRQITKTVAQIAQKLKQEGALSSGGGRAIVDYLIASNQLTDEQIRDHSLTFMFAGFDTSSNTIQWTLALLAKHQGVQDKLFEELQDAMGPNTCPDIDDIKQIRYLQHVVKESMRYRPVISTLSRDAKEDDVLPYSGQTVPKGSTLMVSIYAAHRCPDVYGSSAKEFLPERWEDPSLIDRCERLSGFIPFSIGTRNCIGRDFAWNEILVVLSVILRNFKVLPSDDPLPPKGILAVVVSPEPYKLRLVRRDV